MKSRRFLKLKKKKAKNLHKYETNIILQSKKNNFRTIWINVFHSASFHIDWARHHDLKKRKIILIFKCSNNNIFWKQTKNALENLPCRRSESIHPS